MNSKVLRNLVIATLVGILCSPVCASDAETMEIARARVIAIGWVCSRYQIENGTFPGSMGDLYWPTSFVAYFEGLYGVSFDEITRDPLTTYTARFLIKPVVRSWPEADAIEWDYRTKARYVILSIREGGRVHQYDQVLTTASLARASEFEDPAAPVQYLSDDRWWRIHNSPEFDILEVLRAAKLKKGPVEPEKRRSLYDWFRFF